MYAKVAFFLKKPNNGCDFLPFGGIRGLRIGRSFRSIRLQECEFLLTFAHSMKTAIRSKYAALGADSLVLLWLGVWWVCNVVQAGCTELANDEAYYHLFAERLAWGYFDHPPMTALLVWLGEALFGGELGVRILFTVLQPLYLWILWRLIRPADAGRGDATLFLVLSSATLMLQLYGFIAVPDGPLLMASALFLLTFKWFSERRRLSWLWMGVAMALMGYSKYHGILVVIFAFAANPRLILRPRLLLSGLVAILLLVPHLLWQYHHDWASFVYHLSSRNSLFRFGYVVEFLVNMLVVFNPFFVPVFVQAWRKSRPDQAVGRALRLFPAAFVGFFLLSAFRGAVQPQWVIVASFGFVALLFGYARRHPRTRRYLLRAGSVTLGLLAAVRLCILFNPLGLRAELFDNEASYGAIASEAAGRPVLFRHRYSVAAKYRFYTGCEAYCQPNVYYRTHQWQFRDDDTRFAGREVLVEVPAPSVPDTTGRVGVLRLANGGRFAWVVDPDFRPVRRVGITFCGLPSAVSVGDTLRLPLRFVNPYPYAVSTSDTVSAPTPPLRLAMVWKQGRFRVEEFRLPNRVFLPGFGQAADTVTFRVPPSLSGGGFDVGFALVRDGYTYWFNGMTQPTEVRP